MRVSPAGSSCSRRRTEINREREQDLEGHAAFRSARGRGYAGRRADEAELIVREGEDSAERLTAQRPAARGRDREGEPRFELQRASFRLEVQKMLELFSRVGDGPAAGRQDRPLSYREGTTRPMSCSSVEFPRNRGRGQPDEPRSPRRAARCASRGGPSHSRARVRAGGRRPQFVGPRRNYRRKFAGRPADVTVDASGRNASAGLVERTSIRYGRATA